MRSDAPNPGLGLAILRVVTGVIFVAHGAPKLFGGGVEGMAGMLGNMGVPLSTVAAWGVTLLEFFGGLALIVGLLVAPVAVLLALHMLMGIVLVHAAQGFYVVGSLAPPEGPGGVEFNLLLIAGLLALIFAGSGAAALDSTLSGDGGAGGADAGSGPGG